MLLFKLMSFFVGYVVIKATGKAPEKFVNMAASRGICLWDIARAGEDAVFISVRLPAVKPLRHIARRTGCRYCVQARRGLPFLLARMRRRQALALGFVFFVGAMYFLASFVWFIEVRGNERLTAAEVLDAAAGAGLVRGMPKWQIRAEQVEAGLQERLPLLAWTGVYFQGTKVTIEVAERALPAEEDRRPAHVVAAKAGVIKEVLVVDGNPLVREGDTVAPGQVLISGAIPPLLAAPSADQKPETAPQVLRPAYYVHARGIVRARVWYEDYGEAQLVETGYRPTGRSEKRHILKYYGRETVLFPRRDISFDCYEVATSTKKLPGWRNLDLPVELITEKYLELAAYREERGRQEAGRIAGEAAVAGIMRQLPGDAVVQGRWLEDVSAGSGDQTIRIKAVFETVEDIGVDRLVKP